MTTDTDRGHDSRSKTRLTGSLGSISCVCGDARLQRCVVNQPHLFFVPYGSGGYNRVTRATRCFSDPEGWRATRGARDS